MQTSFRAGGSGSSNSNNNREDRGPAVVDRLLSLLSSPVTRAGYYVEVRYHSRLTSEVNFVNGELERIRVVETAGCCTRVLADGCWGFSSTTSLSPEALRNALENAVSMAHVLAQGKKNRVRGLAEARMARGVFKAKVNGSLADVDMEQKVKIVREAEAAARKHANNNNNSNSSKSKKAGKGNPVKAASCVYRELLDHKVLVNSDGAQAEIYDSKPEFGVTAIARKGGQSVTAHEGVGVTGGWNDLFAKKSHLDYAYEASEKAAKLLGAGHPGGEKTTVILDPGMVGLLSHEAIGHTVEADFVLSGSVVRGKLGSKVASELVTLVDSGRSDIAEGAAGTMPVDDEGVEAGRTAIIEDGILKSYLHNRESALAFGTSPTGNARAFTYSDEPLIRMRNTYVEPRSDKLDDMVKETRHGYLVRGARNGQADANGEFMFGSQEVYLIEGGEVREIMRGASISGNAFEVLQSVDMVGDRFEYDIGTGYCGKYQPAKVDGGGPHLRCTAVVGGLQ